MHKQIKLWLSLYITLFLITLCLAYDSGYFLLLTVAQMVYVPVMLSIIIKKGDWLDRYGRLLISLGVISVFVLMIIPSDGSNWVFSSIYLFYTIILCCYGIWRFLNRGFIHFEEFLIDISLIYLAIGGLWAFAHYNGIDTGFSPMITWLTSIHFHYASFLLPLYAGLLGRILQGAYRGFYYSSIAIISAPIMLAIGIAVSYWLEVVSVILYVYGIYGMIYYATKARVDKWFHKSLVVISFAALGVTILFSCAYIFSRFGGSVGISIPFMLQFHGITNGLFFALAGCLAWGLIRPQSRYIKHAIPMSRIKGELIVGENVLTHVKDTRKVAGLVEDLQSYTSSPIPQLYRDFYERTTNYRLFATVRWSKWFKPFAVCYHQMSRFVKQIHLPLSPQKLEMEGEIAAISPKLDGRESPRAWVRKINNRICFIAIYSAHEYVGKKYMNISLPLPFSNMTGILSLKMEGEELILKSFQDNEQSHEGIYWQWKNHYLRLPINEQFTMYLSNEDQLMAKHRMWILGIPFLFITYEIVKKAGKTD